MLQIQKSNNNIMNVNAVYIDQKEKKYFYPKK